MVGTVRERRFRWRSVVAGAAAAVTTTMLWAVPASAAAMKSQPVSAASLPEGFRAVGGDGGVFDFGTSRYLGSLPGEHVVPRAPVVGMASTPDGLGYWLVASDGGIFCFGQTPFLGSLGGVHLTSPIVGMASTPDGDGYWLVASDGGVFAFGDAPFHGSLGGVHLSAPIVGMASTPDGNGYWLVASDGGVFAFGDAPFHGSLGGVHLSAPIVAIAAPFAGVGSSSRTFGYWLTARDGGVFAFDAPYAGSLPSRGLQVSDAIGLTPTVDNRGYWIARSDGAVYSFGSAPFIGDFQTQMAAAGDPTGTLDRPWIGLSTVAPPGAVAGISVTAPTISFSSEPPPVQEGSPSSPHYMCPPVRVSVTSGDNGQGLSNVPVTLNYAGSADPGLYYDGQKVPSTGVTVETDSTGTATFGTTCSSSGSATSGLGASNLGAGYRLSAQSPITAAPAVSDPFSVVQFEQTCTTDCSSGRLTSAPTGTTATVSSTGRYTYDLIASFGLGALECDSEVTTTPGDPILVQTTPVSPGASAYTLVAMTFPKSVMNSLADNGTPLMPVCAGATVPFQGATRYPQDAYQYQGLLPDCTGTYLGDPAQFCVVSRQRNEEASETVDVYVGADYGSDPSFW